MSVHMWNSVRKGAAPFVQVLYCSSKEFPFLNSLVAEIHMRTRRLEKAP